MSEYAPFVVNSIQFTDKFSRNRVAFYVLSYICSKVRDNIFYM